MKRLAVVLASVCACSAGLDDTQKEAWSDSRGGPDGLSSSDYGVAVTSVDRELPGATIVVAGGDGAAIATLSYDIDGVASDRGFDVPEAAAISAGNLAGSGAPVAGGDGVFVIGAVDGSIHLYDARTGQRGPLLRQTVLGSDCGGDLQEFGSLVAIGPTGVGDEDESDLIAIAGSELLVFPDIDLENEPQCLRCTLTDSDGMPASAIALSLVDFDELPESEILVAVENAGPGTASALLGIDAARIALGGTCASSAPVIIGLSSEGLEPDFGATIATGDLTDDDDPDVVLSSPSSSRVYALLNLGAEDESVVEIIPPAGARAFGTSLALGDFDGDELDELAVGDPLASPDAVSEAGRVTIYSFSPTEGAEPDQTIYDSAPEAGQHFGRALSVAEFVGTGDDADLLLVTAVGEVFTYFRSTVSGSDPRRE